MENLTYITRITRILKTILNRVPQFSLAHSHAAATVDPDDFIDDVADVMVGANDDEWKEMIAEEIRHINAHKGEEGMLDEDERFIGGGGGMGGEGGISITTGDDDGENRKGVAIGVSVNLLLRS